MGGSFGSRSGCFGAPDGSDSAWFSSTRLVSTGEDIEFPLVIW